MENYITVVFYFAGHGFEMHGKFMLPVDTPGPDDYLHTDGICERELLKTILSTNPKVRIQGVLDVLQNKLLCIGKFDADLAYFDRHNNFIILHTKVLCEVWYNVRDDVVSLLQFLLY